MVVSGKILNTLVRRKIASKYVLQISPIYVIQ